MLSSGSHDTALPHGLDAITFIVAALGVEQRAATRGGECSSSVASTLSESGLCIFVAGLGKSLFGELAVREFHWFEWWNSTSRIRTAWTTVEISSPHSHRKAASDGATGGNRSVLALCLL